MNTDITWCSQEGCPNKDCFRNMEGVKFEPNIPISMAPLKYTEACPLQPPEGDSLTLVQIADKHEIDYQIVYNAVSASGLLRRYRKGWLYNEREVLNACVGYLRRREMMHEEKLYEFYSKRQHVEDCLKRLEINDLDLYQK